MSKVCSNCQKINDDDSLFCEECGSSLAGAAGGFVSIGGSAFTPPDPSPFPSLDDAADGDVGAMPDTLTVQQPPAAPLSPFSPASADADALFAKLASLEEGIASLLRRQTDLADRLDDVLGASTRVEMALEGADAEDGVALLEARLNDIEGKFDDKIARNEHESTVLKQMSSEVQEARDGLYAKLTLPLVRNLIEARTALGSVVERHGNEEGMAAVVEEIELCRSMLADNLARNGVEIVTTQPGDALETFRHKVVATQQTDDEEKVGTVAAVHGESYLLGDQYIEPALVEVYARNE